MDDTELHLKLRRGQKVTHEILTFLEKNQITMNEVCACFFSILSSQIDSEEQILPLCKALEKACYISIEVQKSMDLDE